MVANDQGRLLVSVIAAVVDVPGVVKALEWLIIVKLLDSNGLSINYVTAKLASQGSQVFPRRRFKPVLLPSLA